MRSFPLHRRRSALSRGLASSRRGFTLLEVLLAAALGTVLVTVCFQAAHLNWKYRLASEAAIEESRVRLGLLEDLTLDLRAALAPVDLRTARSAERGGRRELLPQTDFSEQFLNVDVETPTRPLHFIGTPDALLLLREQGNPRFPATSADAAGIQQVVWWCRSAGAPRLPYALSGHRRLQRAPDMPRDADGLMRTVWPLHEGFPAARGAALPRSQVVEASISRVSFRYFDGQAWRSGWDSSAERLLPVAIEVSLTWQDAAEPPLRGVLHLPQAGERALPGSTGTDSTASITPLPRAAPLKDP